jgi:hypothetical protein
MIFFAKPVPYRGFIERHHPNLGAGVRERMAVAARVSDRDVESARREQTRASERIRRLAQPGTILCLPTAPSISPLLTTPWPWWAATGHNTGRHSVRLSRRSFLHRLGRGGRGSARSGKHLGPALRLAIVADALRAVLARTKPRSQFLVALVFLIFAPAPEQDALRASG